MKSLGYSLKEVLEGLYQQDEISRSHVTCVDIYFKSWALCSLPLNPLTVLQYIAEYKANCQFQQIKCSV